MKGIAVLLQLTGLSMVVLCGIVPDINKALKDYSNETISIQGLIERFKLIQDGVPEDMEIPEELKEGLIESLSGLIETYERIKKRIENDQLNQEIQNAEMSRIKKLISDIGICSSKNLIKDVVQNRLLRSSSKRMFSRQSSLRDDSSYSRSGSKSFREEDNITLSRSGSGSKSFRGESSKKSIFGSGSKSNKEESSKKSIFGSGSKSYKEKSSKFSIFGSGSKSYKEGSSNISISDSGSKSYKEGSSKISIYGSGSKSLRDRSSRLSISESGSKSSSRERSSKSSRESSSSSKGKEKM